MMARPTHAPYTLKRTQVLRHYIPCPQICNFTFESLHRHQVPLRTHVEESGHVIHIIQPSIGGLEACNLDSKSFESTRNNGHGHLSCCHVQAKNCPCGGHLQHCLPIRRNLPSHCLSANRPQNHHLERSLRHHRYCVCNSTSRPLCLECSKRRRRLRPCSGHQRRIWYRARTNAIQTPHWV